MVAAKSALTAVTVSASNLRRAGSRHRGRKDSGDSVNGAEALAIALVADGLRRAFPRIRSVVPPPRIVLGWQVRRLAQRHAEQQRQRERRRRLVAAAAISAAGAALVGARAVATRH